MSKTYEKQEAARRYDSARALPQETSAFWMATLRDALPRNWAPGTVLDLGAGTGRFAAALLKAFRCPVVAVEPSEAMLKEGEGLRLRGIIRLQGTAESIPLTAKSVDLVWMSQVLHHLDNETLALQEIRRVLSPGGRLAIRNATKENNLEIEWGRCFPEAEQTDDDRIPARRDVVDLVCGQGFETIVTTTVYQYSASSYREYYEKVSQRGLSGLIAMSDDAFEAGLRRLRDWVDKQPPDKPVNEPVDLFVFRVKR